MPSSRENNHLMQIKVYVDKYIKKSFSQREIFISKTGVLHKNNSPSFFLLKIAVFGAGIKHTCFIDTFREILSEYINIDY